MLLVLSRLARRGLSTTATPTATTTTLAGDAAPAVVAASISSLGAGSTSAPSRDTTTNTASAVVADNSPGTNSTGASTSDPKGLLSTPLTRAQYRKWTAQEKAKLDELAKLHNLQNWSAIASEMGTGYKADRLRKRYADANPTVVLPPVKLRKSTHTWTKDEEDKLAQLLRTHGKRWSYLLDKMGAPFDKMDAPQAIKLLQDRYRDHLATKVFPYNFMLWTGAETQAMRKLAAEKNRDWVAIGEILNRPPAIVKAKYKATTNKKKPVYDIFGKIVKKKKTPTKAEIADRKAKAAFAAAKKRHIAAVKKKAAEAIAKKRAAAKKATASKKQPDTAAAATKKKAPAKKAGVAKKAPAKKPGAKKPVVVTRKPGAKKPVVVAKKTVLKKAVAKKAVAKKTAAKKATKKTAKTTTVAGKKTTK